MSSLASPNPSGKTGQGAKTGRTTLCQRHPFLRRDAAEEYNKTGRPRAMHKRQSDKGDVFAEELLLSLLRGVVIGLPSYFPVWDRDALGSWFRSAQRLTNGRRK
jgi:hypothetical protein